jgi:hypothetical protein
LKSLPVPFGTSNVNNYMQSLSSSLSNINLRKFNDNYFNSKSQLNTIFDVIGIPSEEDLSFLDPLTADKIRSLPRKGPKVCHLVSFVSCLFTLFSGFPRVSLLFCRFC